MRKILPGFSTQETLSKPVTSEVMRNKTFEGGNLDVFDEFSFSKKICIAEGQHHISVNTIFFMVVLENFL